MTDGQFNTLQSLLPWMERWTKHRMCRSEPVDKERVNWLSGEFGLTPVCWSCQGYIISRIETFYNLYQKELKNRENGTA